MPSREDILNAKILIVDDSADNVALMREILAEEGYRNVSSTQNPQEVCPLHAVHHFDLILLDLQMPGLNGFQVMRGLKAIESGGYLPVLALTAQPGFKIAALEAGARDFISKPFDLLEVHKRIHNMLEVRLLYRELAQYSKAQAELALHDALTGLPNRRLLEDRISSAVQQASRHQQRAAVLYLDLDGFKAVNDTHGHAVGDELLRMVAQRLVASARKEDTVARLGGDEFVIVVVELKHMADVEYLAAKLNDVISQPYFIQGHHLHISTSIGVSVYPDDATEVEALISIADYALYDAKRSGKNRFCTTNSQPEPARREAARNLPLVQAPPLGRSH